mmetsp:Transcript_21681/g.56277  ORF Transcript_21681/g.56277 Transcript_21681/m.56277 type:complete len:94 (-) Transcript_21681:120-401(-)
MKKHNRLRATSLFAASHAIIRKKYGKERSSMDMQQIIHVLLLFGWKCIPNTSHRHPHGHQNHVHVHNHNSSHALYPRQVAVADVQTSSSLPPP